MACTWAQLPKVTVPAPLLATFQVGAAMSLVVMPNRQLLSEVSTHSRNAAVLLPSSDRNVPVVALGFTQADTVKSLLVVTGGAVVVRPVPVVPSRATAVPNSGSGWYVAVPVAVAFSGVRASSLAVVTVPLVASPRAQVWSAVLSFMASWRV